MEIPNNKKDIGILKNNHYMEHFKGCNTLVVVHNHEGLDLDYYAKVEGNVIRDVLTNFHGGTLPCFCIVNI